MKKIFLAAITAGLFCLIIIPSCSKSSAYTQEPPTETSLKFKVNGTVYEWKYKGFCGLYCGTSILKWPDHYVLGSTGVQHYSDQLSLIMQSTVLSGTTYSYIVASPVTSSNALNSFYLYNPVSGGSYSSAASTEIGDFANITITNIHNTGGYNYANGIFSARLTQSPYGIGAPKADITEGEFYNVIIYQ